jgi:hypothetical protein
MKLAEALIERADMQKKLTAIQARLTQNAKVQEGEKPAEPVEELLLVFDSILGGLETIIKRINRTNAATAFRSGTLVDAIAERDCLRRQMNGYRELYEAAAIKQERYSRSEVKYVRQVDTVALQKKIDELSKQYRKLDTEVQAANWATELVE